MSESTPSGRVLIVDDNANALKALQYVLDKEGFPTETARSGPEALEQLASRRYQVLVTDLMMPEMNGMEVLRRVRSDHSDIPVLILTAHGSVESAVQAVKDGAYDYLQKPFRPEEIILKIRQAIERKHLSEEVRRLKAKVHERRGMDAIIGNSSIMTKVLDQIKTIADKDVSVIVYGESGTGKELAARAVHQASLRRDRPFVAVNCASIPETLLENELFGHIKGAYTGASSNQKGLFEEAHTGTIFLDEVGDIPLGIQAKLLRVLQEQEFKKIGGSRDIRVDVRVVSATNRDLKQLVDEGRFREDVYYRLNVVPMKMPALRERIEDIPLLANYFRNLLNDELNLALKGFTDTAVAEMLNYPWPGNVRELKNKIKMAMVMTRDSRIGPEDLGFGGASGGPAFKPFQVAREEFERDYIARALRICEGNVKKAAKIAKRDRSTFYDLLRKYEITADAYRD